MFLFQLNTYVKTKDGGEFVNDSSMFFYPGLSLALHYFVPYECCCTKPIDFLDVVGAKRKKKKMMKRCPSLCSMWFIDVVKDVRLYILWHGYQFQKVLLCTLLVCGIDEKIIVLE